MGFELYTQMLETTVRELQGQEAPRAPAQTQINLGLPIRIPPEYVPDENQRLRMYKRVAGVETESQLADVRAELADRYGPPPAAVGHLLEYAALRLLAAGQGVTMIDRRRSEVQVHFSPRAAIDAGRLARFVAGERGAQFTPAGVLKFALKSTQASDVLARLRELLLHLAPGETIPGAARGTFTTTEKA